MKIIFNDSSTRPIRNQFINSFRKFSTIVSENEATEFFDMHICRYEKDINKLTITVNDNRFYNKLQIKKFKDELSANLDVTFEDDNCEIRGENPSSDLFITENLNNELSNLDQFIELLEKQIKEYKEAKEKLELIHQLYLNSEQL